MSECKHGLKQGCYYCHGGTPKSAPAAPAARKTTTRRRSALSEQMNERMTVLKQRLRKLRGE